MSGRAKFLVFAIAVVVAALWLLSKGTPRPPRTEVKPFAVEELVVRPELARAWLDGAKIETDFARGVLHQKRAGDVVIESGRLSATDAIIRDGVPPYAVPIPPGRYPVWLSMFDVDGEVRVAFARVELGATSTTPRVWRIGESAVAVDSGTAAFYDAEAGGSGVSFESGIGDGGYPIYFGFDEAGHPATVLIDFGLATEEEPLDFARELKALDAGIAAGGAVAYAMRANLQRRAGNLASALADVTHAIELEPSDSLYLTRGRIHMDRGDFTAAIDDATHAAKDVSTPFALALRADAEAAAGQTAAALADYDKALAETRLHDGELRRNRGMAKLESGDVAGAIADLETACKQAAVPHFCIELARAYRKHGDEQRAKDLIDGTVADARAALDKTEKKTRGWRAPALWTLARVHHAMEDDASTKNILLELIAAEPKSASPDELASAYLELARTELRLHEPEAALEAANKVADLLPTNAQAHYQRARAKRVLGQDPAADFARALELSANAPVVTKAMNEAL